MMDEEKGEAGPPQRPDDDAEAWKAKAALYRVVIERYKDYISQNEQKTVPMLKSLVSPDDATIQSIAGRIREKIRQKKTEAAGGAVVESKDLEYSHENDFLDAAKESFAFVQSLKKADLDIGVSFWLSFCDIERLGVADPFDRALLLCSLLAALGSKSARVSVLALEDGSSHPVVLFEGADGKKRLLDACNGKAAFEDSCGDDPSQLVQAFRSEQGLAAESAEYEFNREQYEESGQG